jgi:hypothetical protein
MEGKRPLEESHKWLWKKEGEMGRGEKEKEGSLCVCVCVTSSSCIVYEVNAQLSFTLF